MHEKVALLPTRTGRRPPVSVSDFWFAQIDLRLARLEQAVNRLERKLWLVLGLGLILAFADLGQDLFPLSQGAV